MISLRHYRDTGTDLDLLYRSIVDVLRGIEGISIVKELVGDSNGKPFRSVAAVSISIPTSIIGSLREVTITITGNSDDFAVEVHTGIWFNLQTSPSVGSPLVGGPLGEMIEVSKETGMATNFHEDLCMRIGELIREHSIKEVPTEKITQLI